MFLAALVVLREAFLKGIRDKPDGQSDGRTVRRTTLPHSPFPFPRRVFRSRLEGLQRPPGVAVRLAGQQGEGVVVDLELQVAQPLVAVLQSALHQGADVLFTQRLEHEHATA